MHTLYSKKKKKIAQAVVYLIASTTILLVIILFPIVAFSSTKVESDYIYFEDRAGFSAHEYQNKLKTSIANFHHTCYNAKDNDTTYSYNQATVTTSIVGKKWNIVAGPGIISSSTGRFNLGYLFIADIQPNYNSNIELSADRLPVIVANPQQPLVLSDYNSDNTTLTGEYRPTKYLNVVVGVLSQHISDGNMRYGALNTIAYDINDNISLVVKNKYVWSMEQSSEYFSPDLYEYHRFLVNYSRLLWSESVIFKVSAGPNLVNISSRREVVPYYDVRILYNTEKDGKFAVGYNCIETTFKYRLCQINGNFQINF